MPTLLDTTVWIDFFNGVDSPHVERLKRVVREGDAAVGDLILCEVLQGIRDDGQFELVRRHFEPFPVLSMVGAEIALQSARQYRALRHRGITVRKTIDCLIAAFCIHHDLVLLHNDRDFDPFARLLGLRVAPESAPPASPLSPRAR